MKRALAITSLSILALSMGSFVACFFFDGPVHYVLLGFGIIAISFLLCLYHEFAHVLSVKMMGSRLVAVHVFPFRYEERAWHFGTRHMAVDFIEPNKKKSAFIYFNGFLFSTLLEGLFIVCFVLWRNDVALTCLILNGIYFLTVPFRGGDLYNFFARL